MNVLISACAADNGKSGIGHYIRATTERLARQSGSNLGLTLYTDHGESFLDDLQKYPEVKVIQLPRMFSSVMGNIAWHWLILPLLALRDRPDLLLFLAGNRRLSWVPWADSLAVVHDLSQLHIKGKYDRFRTFYVLKCLTFLMRRVTRVVSVSHSTRRDLEGYARVLPERIDVVHNGAELARFATPGSTDVLKKYGIHQPYLVYTARLEHPGKNHINLLSAFRNLRNFRDLQLVLTGSPWTGADAIYAEAEKLGLQEQVVFTGYVPNEDLPALIQNAEVFVFPSFFEGFGIPLLEAMAAGTAICAADRSSLPEVAGPAALLFNPDDVTDMARVVQKALSDTDLRQQLIKMGRERASRFTWDKSASELLNQCRKTALLTQLRKITRQLTI